MPLCIASGIVLLFVSIQCLITLGNVPLKSTVETQPEPPNAIAPFEPLEALTLQTEWARFTNGPAIVELPDLAMKFSLIPPGVFLMGAEPAREKDETDFYFDARPQHWVLMTRLFYLSQTPVTQRQWKSIVGGDLLSTFSASDLLPVTFISWQDATKFCRALTEKERASGRLPYGWEYSLPTEAQWEYACRAGAQTIYCFGDNETLLKQYAWFDRHKPENVGLKNPNPWSLYDMHGNVWEWCLDYYKKDYYSESPENNPQGPKDGLDHVIRGGSCFASPRLCTSATRRSKSGPSNDVGFRIAVVMSDS